MRRNIGIDARYRERSERVGAVVQAIEEIALIEEVHSLGEVSIADEVGIEFGRETVQGISVLACREAVEFLRAIAVGGRLCLSSVLGILHKADNAIDAVVAVSVCQFLKLVCGKIGRKLVAVADDYCADDLGKVNRAFGCSGVHRAGRAVS